MSLLIFRHFYTSFSKPGYPCNRILRHTTDLQYRASTSFLFFESYFPYFCVHYKYCNHFWFSALSLWYVGATFTPSDSIDFSATPFGNSTGRERNQRKRTKVSESSCSSSFCQRYHLSMEYHKNRIVVLTEGGYLNCKRISYVMTT